MCVSSRDIVSLPCCGVIVLLVSECCGESMIMGEEFSSISLSIGLFSRGGEGRVVSVVRKLVQGSLPLRQNQFQIPDLVFHFQQGAWVGGVVIAGDQLGGVEQFLQVKILFQGGKNKHQGGKNF